MQKIVSLAFSAVLIVFTFVSIPAQPTEFTYQGSLNDGVDPANGNYDFEFRLFDALAGGSQIGATLTRSSVPVANGVFGAELDFGSEFPGAARFLEIRVRPSGGGSFVLLAPRQLINSAPYAVKSLTAANAAEATTAANALSLGSIPAAQYVLTGDARLSNARDPLPGSANYIQNTTSQQGSSNFNISGNGTLGGTLSSNIVNATLQYDLGGTRVFATPGAHNLFVGATSGSANTTGLSNSFFGSTAGTSNTTGNFNSFFGHSAGRLSNTTSGNSFFGHLAGDISVGANNSFFGRSAGAANTTGGTNSFFGANAGDSNTTGGNNTVIGFLADVGAGGLFNATALGTRAMVDQSNTLVLGSISGVNGAAATVNVGIGTTAPTERLHVVGNGLFTGDLTVSGAYTGNIAAGSLTGIVSTSNGGTGLGAPGISGNFLKSNGSTWTSTPLSASDLPAGNTNYIQNSTTQQGTSNFNISGNGTAANFIAGTLRVGSGSFILPSLRLGVDPTGLYEASTGVLGFSALGVPVMSIHANNSRVSIGNAPQTGPSFDLSFNGQQARNIGLERRTTATSGSALSIRAGGAGAGSTDMSGGSLILQSGIGTGLGGSDIVFQTALPSVSGNVDNSLVTRMTIRRDGNVGIGTVNPTDRLHVDGTIRVQTLGAGGSGNLCWNLINQISLCSSSLRYKTGVKPFPVGLDLAKRLNPIMFDWKDGGMRDIGLGAEDVEAVEPLLVTYNEKGEVEGVKYDRISVVLINAIKEQQAEIESTRRENKGLTKKVEKLQEEMVELKEAVCRLTGASCKP